MMEQTNLWEIKVLALLVGTIIVIFGVLVLFIQIGSRLGAG